MSLKVDEFVIQAKILEDQDPDHGTSGVEREGGFPASIKKEIIDECLEKVKEYLEREQSRH